MAIRNLVGRGIGFGAVHWITTHGYSSGSAPSINYVLLPGVVIDIDLRPTVLDVLLAPVVLDPLSPPTVSSP